MPDEYDPLISAEKRDIPQSERDKIPAAEFAGPHESFPIAKPEDIASAAHLIGKADDPEAVKARIIAIAKKHGWEKYLPAAWDAGEEGSEKPGAPDEPESKEAEEALFERFATRLVKALTERTNRALGRKSDDNDAPLVGGFKVFTDAKGDTRWMAWYSNNFEDREKEFFSEKGFDRYVQRVDMGIVPAPELWSWHTKGTRYGQADWVDRIGHFHVATGTYDDTPIGRAGKAYDAEHWKEYGVSHGFIYRKSDVEVVDGKKVFNDWNSFEISPLPLHRAANELTAFAVEHSEGIKESPMDAEKRKHLIDKYQALGGETFVAGLEAESEKLGKGIEELKGYKDFVHPDSSNEANANKEALANADKAFGELMPQLVEGSGEAVAAALQSVKAVTALQSQVATTVKALEDKYADAMKQIDALRAEMDLRPRESARAASKSASTKIDDDHPLLKQSQLGMDEGLKEALPGLFKS